MNDKKIISAISIAYFIITSFLIFISLTLSILFIVLQNGLFIENISTQHFNVKQLYIKWNESLDISIKEIKIQKTKSQTDSKIELEKISSELSKLSNYYNIFEKISINKILYDDIQGSFKYTRGGNGYVIANSQDFHLDGSLLFESNILNIQVNKLQDERRDINASGNILLDMTSNAALANMHVNIQEDIKLDIFVHANQDRLLYKALSDEKIKNISTTIALLNLHPGVIYWADTAIRFSSVSLKGVHGWIDFNDVDNAYKNVYAHAIGKDLKYKYNTSLDDIHTKTTDVIFKDGMLLIYPRKAYTYKSKLGKSWIKIDFTQPEEQLSIKLLFDGQLDKETLGILEAYKIKVPFLQNTGVTNVDLTIDVNLRTIGVNAQGKFFAKKANFNYMGHNIDVFNASIKLDNYEVIIDRMLAKYDDIATAKVLVHYNAKESKGKIDFDFSKIHFSDLGLGLNTQQQSTLKAKYIIAPNNDRIIVPSSLWDFKSYPFYVDSVTAPFDLKTLLLKIPYTKITSPKLAQVDVHGLVDFNTMIYDFKATLENIHVSNISLIESKEPTFNIKYDKALTIESSERVLFKVSEFNSFINKPFIEIKDGYVNMRESYVNIDELVKAKISAKYSLVSNKGKVKTKRLRIKTETLGDLYFEPHDTNFEIRIINKDFIASSEDLKVDFLYNEKLWQFDADSATRLAQNSKLLQKYNVTRGNATVYKVKDEKYIHIKSKVFSANEVVVKNNIPTGEYFINGKIEKHSNIISLNVNENIDVTIDKDVSIRMHDIGINLNALSDIVQAKKDNLKNYSSTHVDLKATNTYLYLTENRHILSEKIDLDYTEKLLKAKLYHKDGKASLQFKNGVFHIEGKNFNDTFMENLIALSKFQDGNFSFKLSGKPLKYDGIFTITDTTMLEYKALNNILAFVNTIPALVTFSTPSYNKEGLHIQTAYMKFNSENNLLHISDISLDSKELDILGSGKASIQDNTIDVELNLKTDLGSKVSQVPLVGYILMDKDSMSTSLKLTGALNNPKVNSLIAKDIAVAPLNILLRAVTLPYYLVNPRDKNSTNEEIEENSEWINIGE